MFSENLKNAIRDVSGQVVPDMMREDASDKSAVAETVLDADRLLFFSHMQAHEEFKELLKEHDFATICKEAEKYVYIY